MPADFQIVPAWQQPHVQTYIYDNTFWTDDTDNDNEIKFISAFMSSRGIDNKLIKVKDAKTFLNIFGGLNFAKYGQPQLNAYAELKNANADVWCMRVMPENASYANAIISLCYKTDAATGKFTIKFVSDYVENLTGYKYRAPEGMYHTEDEKFSDTKRTYELEGLEDELIKVDPDAILKAKAATLKTTEPDGDGYVKIPIMRVYASGRGSYGNGMRFRVVNNVEYEKDYGIKVYEFEAIGTTNGLKIMSRYYGSAYTSPRYDESILIGDVITDMETGYNHLYIQTDEEAFEEVYDAFSTFMDSLDDSLKDSNGIPEIDEFDPFFGLICQTYTAHKNINFDITSENAISLDAATGLVLYGGSDGDFSDLNTAAERTKAIDNAYINAFNGTWDRIILAPRRVPAVALLDANYSLEVKKALYELMVVRDDAPCYFDAGIMNDTSELRAMIRDFKTFTSRLANKDFQHYKVRDPITKKKIAVTTTYFYAQNMANHFLRFGYHIPFVKRYCTLNGHIKNSLRPAIEIIDMELKEELYNARFNYFEAIAENEFAKGCQNTAQPGNSDLLEISNVHSLYRLKRIIENDCHDRLYNFAEAEERKSFKDYEEAKFADWVGTILQSFSIEFSMTPWEAERSILHCYVAIQFRTLNKRTIVEIDVNKRDFTA